VVVGVAIIDGGRVLAARRRHPPSAAGRWELPGGKAESGESVRECAVREIREELGCGVTVDSLLEPRVPIKQSYTLCVVTATLTDGEPVPREHDALRWLARHELRAVDWLEPDLPFLPLLEERLS
jgi:8-oxo-dGTP diphosphatase